jgi:hypothetical protein
VLGSGKRAVAVVAPIYCETRTELSWARDSWVRSVRERNTGENAASLWREYRQSFKQVKGFPLQRQKIWLCYLSSHGRDDSYYYIAPHI